MKKGFTLVELSIVLVIIGLLIGGILVGQSLINSAAISSTIAQIGRYDAAVGGFTAKHKFLPGDAPGFGGNGDGLVGRKDPWGTCVGGTQDTANITSGEILNFWNQIFPQEYIATNYASWIYRSALKTRMPSTNLGIKDGFFIASAVAVSSGPPPWCIDNTARENYYVMVSPYNYPSCFQCNDFGQGAYQVFHSVAAGNNTLSPLDMAALDIKMDDGVPSIGNVIAGSFRGGNSGPSKEPIVTCSSGSAYLISDSGYQCMPLIRIGAAGGY